SDYLSDTALCADLKLREFFERFTEQSFQKILCTTQNLNRLPINTASYVAEKGEPIDIEKFSVKSFA
ncbi:MAG: hypothetical protein ACK470_09470, partial [Pseudanabaena sp.]